MISAEEEALSFIRDNAGGPNEKQALEEIQGAHRWTTWISRGMSAAMALVVYVAVEHPTAPGFALIVYLLAQMPAKLGAGASVNWALLLLSTRSSELAIRRIQMQLSRDGDGEDDDDDGDLTVPRAPAPNAAPPHA